MIGRTQRALCAGILAIQAVVLFLTTPVLLTLTRVPTALGLGVGLGLTGACLVAAGLQRRPSGAWLGWAVQGASIVLGVLLPTMVVLGVVFLTLYAGAWRLGARVDGDREQREAALTRSSEAPA